MRVLSMEEKMEFDSNASLEQRGKHVPLMML